MDISHLSKAKVLTVLFNNAKPLGLGFLDYKKDHVMTEAEAAELAIASL